MSEWTICSDSKAQGINRITINHVLVCPVDKPRKPKPAQQSLHTNPSNTKRPRARLALLARAVAVVLVVLTLGGTAPAAGHAKAAVAMAAIVPGAGHLVVLTGEATS